MSDLPPAGDPIARHSLSPTELQQLMAAEREGSAFLAYRDEGGSLQFFSPADRDGASTIGRRAEANLCIGWDSQVSGLHAEIHHAGGEWTIADDGLSTNGTYVDERRVAGRQRLQDGSRVRVGRTILAYRAAQATAIGETVVASSSAPRVQLTETQRNVLVALCRPYRDNDFATPATNQEIAGELFLSVDAVKMHLRTLFGKFALGDLPQNQKRARLAETALQSGAVTRHELG